MRLSSILSYNMRYLYYIGGDFMNLENIQIRLRESISSSSYTQKEIAKAIGVSAQTVSKYMKNNIFPALDTFAKLCKFLDVKADYVLGICDY